LNIFKYFIDAQISLFLSKIFYIKSLKIFISFSKFLQCIISIYIRIFQSKGTFRASYIWQRDALAICDISIPNISYRTPLPLALSY